MVGHAKWKRNDLVATEHGGGALVSIFEGERREKGRPDDHVTLVFESEFIYEHGDEDVVSTSVFLFNEWMGTAEF